MLYPALSEQRAALNPVALGLALLAWSGVLLQLFLSLRLAQANGHSLAYGLVVYLGYFTVLTNLFVALVLSALAVPAHSPSLLPFLRRPGTLGCAATSIALVGLGYHFLLRNIWDPQGAQWLADTLLHYVTPMAFCVYWLWALPKAGLGWRAPWVWCLYPLLYFAYAMVRGEWLGTYPYPFIDVGAIGYPGAFTSALGLLVVFLIVAGLLLAVGRAIEQRRSGAGAKA